jgi:aryl-alcohol dehydrogenase-like predicted oxidoreductase
MFYVFKMSVDIELFLSTNSHKLYYVYENFIAPIPGSRQQQNLLENVAAAEIVLTDLELQQI